MKITYITDFDILNPTERNSHHPKAVGHRGRCFYAAKSLVDEQTTVQYLCPLSRKSALISKLKWRFYRYILQQRYIAWAEPSVSQNYAAQIKQRLSNVKSDVVMAPEINLLAYLECDRPLVLWTDTPYAGLFDGYTDFSHLCRETINHLTTMDRLTLHKCQLVIFPSKWAADIAIKNYQVDPAKVEVVPFGANIECDRTLADIQSLVNARSQQTCKLLFIGVDWVRKGGTIALNVAKQLQENGLDVELIIVGCQPPENEYPLPDFVKPLGFINKSTPAGLAKFNSLIAESHFLIVPSQAETYGNVFCEANSFGVPCLATNAGGIATIIRDGINGKTFSPDANPQEYCTYIEDIFSHYSTYKSLALSAFHEYQTRFDWSAAGQSVRNLLSNIV
ncbi:glycosyltransferase family 4 protein [Anabaena subtropica]|uniref:Glycosyltransferase family 4 protein n=1 Tax=Anabaena subtropica FACHB-260 TaxID=2692884 RepID=A0ABR8CU83_9NOST|nr:glycosyltransferase family 4 protein [Anabaena subtropica]MBD2346055.1 glycosyltransferase family 4 protein [Anabaena subtropica FACHB-260]